MSTNAQRVNTYMHTDLCRENISTLCAVFCKTFANNTHIRTGKAVRLYVTLQSHL